MFYLTSVLISLILLTIFLVILGWVLDKFLASMQADPGWKKIILGIVGLIGLASILFGFGRHYLVF